jgi:hypothetical protein
LVPTTTGYFQNARRLERELFDQPKEFIHVEAGGLFLPIEFYEGPRWTLSFCKQSLQWIPATLLHSSIFPVATTLEPHQRKVCNV